LNKKLQKGLVAAVAATLSTGIVAPVYAASVETKSFDAQYAEAYNATVNAKTQKELTAARVLVDKLYADLPQDLKNLAATLSAILDPKQQTELVKLDNAIKAAEVSGKQADVNVATALIVDMPVVWKTSFSSYMDKIQQAVINKAVAAVTKAQASGVQADFDAAKALYEELLTVTNNDGVKSWVETALKAELDKVVVGVQVKSVTAVNAKSLKVAFDKDVDTTKVTFDVKRGTTTKTAVTGLTIAWNDAKTEATLSSDVNLAADTYTVTVGGVQLVAGKEAGSVTVAAQKVTKVDFLSTDLVKNAGGTAATFQYRVLDQYGTDITKNVGNSTFTKSAVIGSGSGTVSLDPSTGTGTVTYAFATTDKTAVVTLVHNATGVNSTTNMNIAAAVTVQDLTFGSNVLPTGKTRIEAGLSTAVTVPVIVKDQYGNLIKDLDTLSAALTPASSNTSVSFSFDSDTDGNPVVVMDTSSLTDKATVVLTLINPTTGRAFTTTFDVVKSSAAYSVTLGEFSKTEIAAGDTNAVLPITVFDQFGNQLTADQIVAQASTIESWISGDAHINNLVVKTDRNSSNYGKLVQSAGATVGIDVIIFNTPAGVVTKQVEVVAARKTTTVSNLANITMIQGASKALEFPFKDQYGVAMTDPTNNTDLTYSVTLTKLSGDDAAVTTSVTTGADESALNTITVNAAANKTGSYKVKVDLLDSTGAVVSSANTTVTVVKNNVAGLTYSVSDIATLNGSSAQLADADNAYAKKVVVSAVDASGNSYVINKADVVSVVSSNTSVATVAKDTDGNWYVAGANISGEDADKTATLTVTVNTLDGVKTFTKTVNVSRAAASVKELKVITAALTAPTTDISDVTNKSTFAIADKTAALAGVSVYVIGLDQYGVWANVTDPTVYVNSTDKATVDAFSYTAGELVLGEAGDVTTVGSDIKVTLTKGSTTIQIIVNIAAEGEV
jgi:hypothetical protein